MPVRRDVDATGVWQLVVLTRGGTEQPVGSLPDLITLDLSDIVLTVTVRAVCSEYTAILVLYGSDVRAIIGSTPAGCGDVGDQVAALHRLLVARPQGAARR